LLLLLLLLLLQTLSSRNGMTGVTTDSSIRRLVAAAAAAAAAAAEVAERAIVFCMEESVNTPIIPSTAHISSANFVVGGWASTFMSIGEGIEVKG
jgi:hypothetical protein